MKRSVKSRFLSRLRRGRETENGYEAFQQTINRLKRSNGDEQYCVMGVLGTVAMEDGVLFEDNHGFVLTPGGVTYDKKLPEMTLAWAGMVRGDQQTLMRMNDDGCTFEELADYIEENM